jgi:hypothetical protein
VPRTGVDAVDEPSQLRTQNHVLHHGAEAGGGVTVGDHRAESVSKTQLGQRFRRVVRPHFGATGHDHPTERVSANVGRPGALLGQELGHRRLSGRHRTGDDDDGRAD